MFIPFWKLNIMKCIIDRFTKKAKDNANIIGHGITANKYKLHFCMALD